MLLRNTQIWWRNKRRRKIPTGNGLMSWQPSSIRWWFHLLRPCLWVSWSRCWVCWEWFRPLLEVCYWWVVVVESLVVLLKVCCWICGCSDCGWYSNADVAWSSIQVVADAVDCVGCSISHGWYWGGWCLKMTKDEVEAWNGWPLWLYHYHHHLLLMYCWEHYSYLETLLGVDLCSRTLVLFHHQRHRSFVRSHPDYSQLLRFVSHPVLLVLLVYALWSYMRVLPKYSYNTKKMRIEKNGSEYSRIFLHCPLCRDFSIKSLT